MKLRSQDKENKLLDKAYSQIEKLIVENKKLKSENKSMKEELSFFRLNHKKENTNSSIPSSYIMFNAKINNRNKSNKHIGGQNGHPIHKSKFLKPDKIIVKYVKSAPTGAVSNYDEYGIEYFKTQMIDMKFKTIVTEYRYYLDDNDEELRNDILIKYMINPAIYNDSLKSQVLFLYPKGIIALDRLSKMINTLSDNRLDIKPSTIASFIHEYTLRYQGKQNNKLQRLLNSDILHVDESGYRVMVNLPGYI